MTSIIKNQYSIDWTGVVATACVLQMATQIFRRGAAAVAAACSCGCSWQQLWPHVRICTVVSYALMQSRRFSALHNVHSMQYNRCGRLTARGVESGEKESMVCGSLTIL